MPQTESKDQSASDNSSRKNWTNEEMHNLYAYLEESKSYRYIAEQLSRTVKSVSRKVQSTDWKSWSNITKNFKLKKSDQESFDNLKEQVVNALLNITRYDINELHKINKTAFFQRINLDEKILHVNFSDIVKSATEKMTELGFNNPETLELKAGTYVIVSDSHGKHTRSVMFEMLKNLNTTLKPNKIIHIGHILDDDNDISYKWEDFGNLIVLSKMEELKIVQAQRHKYNFNFDIVRKEISLGDLIIANQDIIADYAKTEIDRISPSHFCGKNVNHSRYDKMVINCHRMEFFTRCLNDKISYISSPGCLCDDHIVKTVKQIDFADGKTVKQANWEGFKNYRRMDHMNKFWEQGLLIVNVDSEGNHTIIPCPIKKIEDQFVMSYFDKIISSNGVHSPDAKVFINADFHCDKHDVNILDIQDQICKDYKPTTTVSLGDVHNYYSLNHHVMDRGCVITNKTILDESASVHLVLKKMASWASKERYLMYGNHERFASDFISKFPQFGNYLDFTFVSGATDLGYKMIQLKNVLKLGELKIVHGDMKLYGQSGGQLEKVSKTFGRDVFMGHIHRAGIRMGCYSLGFTGTLDQEYNEVHASNWVHGFGLCNQYKGVSFPTTITIVKDKCLLGKKTYKPSANAKKWSFKSYKAKLVYEIQEM